MSELDSAASTLRLLGGTLSLDFVNTVDDRKSEHPHDYLERYEDLTAWGEHAGILSHAEAERLLHAAATRPSEAEAALRQAVLLREALYRVFVNIAEGKKPKDQNLETLNQNLGHAMSFTRLVPSKNGYEWSWGLEGQGFDQMLHPIARSAAELLTSENLDLVRECGAESCGWLFVDSTRNHSRRWCSMDGCGNRAKARRHYEHSRKKPADTKD